MPSNKPLIIIVEDDSLLSQMYEIRLKNENYRANIANNYDELVKILKKTKPDLILLDIILPGKNGLQILKELRSNSKTEHIPVIILTNLTRADSALTPELASNLGIYAYLIKSQTTTEQLVLSVGLCLTRHGA